MPEHGPHVGQTVGRMSPQNARFTDLVRALRGTPQEATARELLHALRREREFRKRVQRLREDQSGRLHEAARELCLLRYETRMRQ